MRRIFYGIIFLIFKEKKEKKCKKNLKKSFTREEVCGSINEHSAESEWEDIENWTETRQ